MDETPSWYTMNIDWLMLVTDSLVCGLSIYLTYISYKLLRILKANAHVHKFGSTEWWNWLEHSIAITLVCGGSFGRSIFKTMHTLEQSITNNGTRSVLEKIEIGNDIFTSVIIMGFIILVSRIAIEEMKYYKCDDELCEERRKNITNESPFLRRIVDRYKETHEI